jgi:superfamily II DNA or RNA helicase
VIFLAYSGEMHWRTRAGDEISATLGAPLTAEQLAQAWRTALDPEGEWVARVLDAADRRLTEVRRDMPDAAGLVIASDHDAARAYAALLRRVTGTRPVVVLSDDKTASKKIAGFAQSEDRWMVAVRMVSEGVDIPRLAVGVFATSVSTALFFAQAVGRFVRARRRGETASVFLPSVPVLLGYAAELEAERDHVLHLRGDEDPERELAEAQRQRDTADDLGEPAFTALGASAHFDRVLYDGGEFGASAEEEEFLGLPGLLEPEQVALLLRKRRADRVKGNAVPSQRAPGAAPAAAPAVPGAVPVLGARPVPVGPGAAPASASTRQVLAGLRKELNGLIAAWHHRTSQPHGAIHADLRRACGGPPLPEATAEQIQARIEMLRRWASGR